jgi:hypothetical protein
MADADRDPEFVGQHLQLAFPQTHAHAIAAAAIGSDQQSPRRGIARRAELVPPAPDALDGEGGGVVVDAEIDPSFVGGDVIHPVGHRLAEFRDDEIMHPDRLGLPLGAQLAPAVLEVANEFLLLGINRDHRLPGRLEGGHHGVDVLELGIAVGMAATLTGFGVGLQAEAQPAQQAADQLLPGGETPLRKRHRQMALAFAHPKQRSPGIAADGRLHQFAQGCQKPRLRLGCRLAATARTTHPATEVRRARLRFGETTIDRAARNPGCLRDRDHPTVTGRPRLTADSDEAARVYRAKSAHRSDLMAPSILI